MALSTPNALPVPANAEAQVSGAGAKGATSGFSTLLTAIGTVPTGAPVPAPGTEPVVVAVAAAATPAEGEPAAATTLPGTALPAGTASGKELPVLLPGLPIAAGDDASRPKEAKAQMAQTPVALPGKAIDQDTAVDEADGDEAAPQDDEDGVEKTTATQFAAAQPLVAAKPNADTVPLPVNAHSHTPSTPASVDATGSAKPAPAQQNPVQQATPQSAPRQADAVQTPANAVAVHVAPEAQTQQAVAAPRPGARDRRPERAAGIEPKLAAHAAEATHGPAPRPLATDPAAQQQPTPSIVAQQNVDLGAPAAQPAGLHRAPPADALRDLTQIVDRLASAREAFAPAAAALAVDHADFGELSLRFNHHRDGRLDVQIAAADPASHRAIAAAVAQQGASHTGENTAQTAQNAQSNTQGQAQARSREASGERDGHAGQGTSARDGQPDARRQAPREQRQASGGRPHGGVFA